MSRTGIAAICALLLGELKAFEVLVQLTFLFSRCLWKYKSTGIMFAKPIYASRHANVLVGLWKS